MRVALDQSVQMVVTDSVTDGSVEQQQQQQQQQQRVNFIQSQTAPARRPARPAAWVTRQSGQSACGDAESQLAEWRRLDRMQINATVLLPPAHPSPPHVRLSVCPSGS